MRRIMRILVAEEDRDYIELIKSSLLNAGDQYPVETVSSGGGCLTLMIFTLNSASEKVIMIACPFRPCIVGVNAN